MYGLYSTANLVHLWSSFAMLSGSLTPQHGVSSGSR